MPVIVERRIESGNNSNNSVSGVNNAGIVSQAETEKLRQENEDLKTRLTESEKKSEELAKQVWEAEKNKIPPLKKTGAAESNAKSDQKPPVLPTINKQGVSVSLDDQNRIHIAVVDSVLFMPNTWQITADGEETLRTIAAEIKASHPKTFLDIEGHTDSLIGDPKNPTQKHGISAVKTMTVMDFFINSLKWDASNIRTSSFGSSRPVADNGTPEGRAKNNRVEIVVVDQ
ncbi:hypothetical protein FACS189454_03300 [Planctomycetales bacterium]|nr:hypothetical protein FACS189454_03300 [Planctomycetales bacterium]